MTIVWSMGIASTLVEKLRLRKSRQRSATILPKPLFDCVVFRCAATARAVARCDPLAFVVCETVTKIECGVRGWRARRGAACELLCCPCPWPVMLALPPVVGRGDRGRAGRSALACAARQEAVTAVWCGRMGR
jgi:hypothetical protein